MGWWQRFQARERQRMTPLDHWIQRQRAYVMRLPKWLVGTSVVSALSLGIWQVLYGRALMPVFSYVYRGHPEYAAMVTIALTMFACFGLLYIIARVLRPPAPTNLPDARVEKR